MPAQKTIVSNTRNEDLARETRRENWAVMRPFVRFSIGAMKIIGLTLLSILRALPSMKHEDKHDNRVVKKRI
jgi:hypothetical protein